MRRVFALLILLTPAARAADLDPFAIRLIADFEHAFARAMPARQWTDDLRESIRRELEAGVRANTNPEWFAAARSRTPWTKRTRRAFSARAQDLADRFAREVQATGRTTLFSPEYVTELAPALRTLGELTALTASFPGNEAAQFTFGVLKTVVPASAALAGASLTPALLLHPAGVGASNALLGPDARVVLIVAAVGGTLTTGLLAATEAGRRSMIAMAYGRGREAGVYRILDIFRARLRERLEADPKMRRFLPPPGVASIEMDLLEKLLMFGDGRAACARWLGAISPGDFASPDAVSGRNRPEKG